MTNGNTLNTLIDTFFTGWTPAWQPSLDVFDASDGYTIVLEAPGLAEKDVLIECDHGVLVVRGEKKVAVPEGATVLRSERGFGAFERRVELTPDVDTAGISATMKNGLLTIRLPRKPEAQPRRIEVKNAE